MVGVSPIYTSVLALLSLLRTPPPPTKNATTTTDARPTTPFNLLTSIVGNPTFKKRVKLYCRTGFHLVMLPGGKIKGSTLPKVVKASGVFELQSFGPSIVRIKSVQHQRYVAIAQDGKVHSTVNASSDTILRQTYGHNSFDSFSSYLYRGIGQYNRWYLAIKQNGHVKNAGKVLRHHKSHQFQVVYLDKKNVKPVDIPGLTFPLKSNKG